MMTWMTRASLFDSALDMEVQELSLSHFESYSLFAEMVFGEADETHGAAPAPLVHMWRGYEVALAGYSVACAATLVSFGVNVVPTTLALAQWVQELRQNGDDAEMVMPPWLADIDVLRSHRSNMMRRWPDRYNWPRTPAQMPYLWPVVDDDGGYELRISKYDRELMTKGERKLPNDIQKRIEK